MSRIITEQSQAQRATLAFVSDAGHGWLGVSLDSEHGFPKAEQFASSYSYIDISGDNFSGIVYLEEDVDAPAFMEAYGVTLEGVQEFTLPDNHVIRDLPRGSATKEV